MSVLVEHEKGLKLTRSRKKLRVLQKNYLSQIINSEQLETLVDLTNATFSDDKNEIKY